MRKTFPISRSNESSAITRVLFHDPFDPKMNFAIKDPLLLSTDKNVLQNGINFSRKFGAGSLLNSIAPKYLKEKIHIETVFSTKISKQASLLIKELKDPFSFFLKTAPSFRHIIAPKGLSFTSTHKNIAYYSIYDLETTLTQALQTANEQNLVVYINKSDLQKHLPLIIDLKKRFSFMLFCENTNLFGIEGFNGFGSLAIASLCDILVTHIPKTFGTLATIISGSKAQIESFSEILPLSQFMVAPAFVGMFSSIVQQMDGFSTRKEKLSLLIKNLAKIFPLQTLQDSTLSIDLDSKLQMDFVHKALIEKGFLINAQKKDHDFSINLHLNYQQDTSSYLTVKYIVEESKHQHISETI